MMFDEQRTHTLLRQADPARGVVVPLPEVSAADLTAREDRPEQAAPRPGRRVVLAAAAVTVAAGATGVAVYPFVRSTKDAAAPPVKTDAGLVVPIAYQIPTNAPPAGSYLRNLARRIGNAPYDVHTGRYTYHHSKWWGGMMMTSPEGYTKSFVEEQEVWAAADGSGRRRHQMLPPEYPDEASRQYYESLPSPTPAGTPPPDGPYEELPAGQVGPTEPLPTNRTQLVKLLDVQYGPGAVAKKLGTLYEEYGIPRTTRALVLDILAGMPGWSWRGEVTDRAGRPGVAITGEDHGQQQLVVFDPKTGLLLAHEVVFLEPKRQVAAYQLLLVMDRTDRLG
jgi:hypothetical protein